MLYQIQKFGKYLKSKNNLKGLKELLTLYNRLPVDQQNVTSHQSFSNQSLSTSHQSFTTSHQSSTTSHQSITTSHLSTTTSHQSFTTSHQSTTTSHQSITTSHQSTTTSHQSFTTSHQSSPSLVTYQALKLSTQSTLPKSALKSTKDILYQVTSESDQ